MTLTPNTQITQENVGEAARIVACHLPLPECPDTACLPVTITAGDLRRVYSALTDRPALSPPAEGEEHICEWRLIAETQDAQYARVTAMIDAAKEAGWAMMEVVDSIAWEKRQQFSDITARLAKSIEAVECQEPATPTPAPVDHIGDATEKIDWERVGPKLVEALKEARSDIIDFVTARWSEYEGTRDDAVAYIDAALDAAQPEAGK